MSKKYTRALVTSFDPYLDEAGLALFKGVISTTSVYLEYGSGGSTLLASKKTDLVVSVDSDRSYLNAIATALSDLSIKSKCELIHVDIGLAGAWGFPVFTKATEKRRERWKRYPKAPWEFLRRQGVEPDTILVDGRFRVACSLESFLNLSKTSTCSILIDDYAERSCYRPIEQFGDLIEMHGRMALFRKKATMNESACREALENFYSDFN
jgi:hypothetical protein